jgi:type IV pilus assembly protein PilW
MSVKNKLNRVTRPNTQRGLTLIELMVALTIGLIIMWGIIQIFTANKQSYATLEGASRLQENGQFTLSFMTQQIRQAGYYPKPILDIDAPKNGAVKDLVTNRRDDQEFFAFGPTDVLVGTDGANNASDSITVAYYTDTTDCVGNNPQVAALPKQAGLGAAIATNFFEIRQGAAGRNSLFCNNTEIAEGVENMQILYGEDTNGDGIVDFYQSQSQVNNMGNVLTIKIAMLVASINEVSTDKDNATYDLLDVQVGPFDDRRIRRVFSTTIKLNNRCTQIKQQVGASNVCW